MARKYIFGQTWWGNLWIKSLENIDRYTNRLPRGKSYAGGGKVLKIEIKDGFLLSQVSGTYVYDQKFNLVSFSEKEMNMIESILRTRSDLSSQLLMGNFPVELKEIFDNLEINFFPEKWSDINSSCTCPDKANPCKHLASVFYVIANEIDKDPLLLFELKGMKRERVLEILDYKETSHDIKLHNDIQQYGKVISEPELYTEKYNICRFIDMLPKNDFFYEGSFGSLLKDFYNCFYDINFESSEENYMHFENTSVNCRFYDGKFKFYIEDKYLNENDEKLKKEITPKEFFGIMENQSFYNFDRDGKYTYFIKKLMIFVINILMSNSFIPYPQKINEKDFIIKYKIIFHNESIKNYYKYLCSLYPGGFVSWRNKYPAVEDSVDILTDIIIKYFTEKYFKVSEGRIENVFFRNKVFTVDGFQDNQVYTNIKNYFEPLCLREGKFRITVKIGEHSNTICSVELFAEDKTDGKSYQLKDYTGENNDGNENILKQISVISSNSVIFSDIFSKNKKFIKFSEIGDFIFEIKSVMNLLDGKIILPQKISDMKTPELYIKISASNSEEIKTNNLSECIKIKYYIKIDREEIEPQKLIRKVEENRGLVNLNNNYILISSAEINKISKAMYDTDNLNNTEIMKILLSGEYMGIKVITDNNIKIFVDNLTRIESVKLPQNLKGELRNYQKKGFRWIWTNLSKGFNVCIADDMGLGKTVQVIAVITKMKEKKMLENKALVICPTTLMGNWVKEIKKFSPGLSFSVYHGTERQMENTDVIITSYGVIRRDISDLEKEEFSVVIIDEAQNIKNPVTSQSIAVKKLKSGKKIAMTGTPVENRLIELWSIYDFLMPGYLGKKEHFTDNFAFKIEKMGDRKVLGNLKNSLKPFLIRRLKTDKTIIKDLPEKIVFDEYVYLEEFQKNLYKSILKEFDESIGKYTGIKKQGNILKVITALKQICNHPANYLKDGKTEMKDSGKSLKLKQLVANITEMDEKMLIFTQYREMGYILEKMFEKEMNIKSLFFHGGLNVSEREKMINTFQENPYYPIMIISLKAGGTGLNLTAANHVIHYDLWWNPAVENQATDRAFRIGQHKNVIVHRFITMNTFEEKINDIINQKRELADNIITAGENWITKLSDEELKKLFSLDE